MTLRGARAPLALFALASAGAAGCCACLPEPTFVVRSPAARDPAPAPPLEGPVVRALHLADFGDDTCQQARVAQGIAEAHRRVPFALALFAGDLLYDCGPAVVPGAEACAFAPDGNTLAPGFTSPPDPGFAEKHEGALGGLLVPPAAEVFVALGNHDVSPSCGELPDPTALERLKACLNVAWRSPLWSMPGRRYEVERGAARFVVIDSNLVRRDYGGFAFADEVAFVAEATQGCAGRACLAAGACGGRPLCFLVAHHPPVTASSHRDDATPEYLARWRALLDAGGDRVRAVLSGHDHDLQHLRSPDGLDVFVSGNGSRGRPLERFGEVSVPGTALHFASVRWGHGVIEIGPSGWRYRFESHEGGPLHCCAARGAGPCEPTTCR